MHKFPNPNFKVRGFRVLVKPLVEEDTFGNSTILKPETHKKEYENAVEIGMVVQKGAAVGRYEHKEFGIEEDIEVGSVVMWQRYHGKKFMDTDGTEYVILNEEDIHGHYSEYNTELFCEDK